LQKLFVKKHQLIFLAAAALILFPTWQKGFLFFLDWGVHPYASLGDIDLWSQSLGKIIFAWGGIILPYGLFQKLALFGLIYFLGIGGWQLAETVLGEKSGPEKIFWPGLFSGLFLIFNPFVYARLADGQWGVVAGILFLLFGLIYLIRFIRDKNKKNFILTAVFMALSSMFTIHTIFFVPAVLLVFFSVAAYHEKKYAYFAGAFLAVMLAVVVLNANVLAGYAFGKSESAQVFSQIDENHLEAFNTADFDNTSIYFNVLSLHGYWGEREERFFSTQTRNYVWKPIWLILFLLMLYGAAKEIKKNKLVWPFLVLAGLAYVLTIGISDSVFRSFNQFLYDSLPFYKGLREPQKWSGVLLITYAALGALGLNNFLKLKETEKNASAWALGLIFLVLLYTNVMLFGFLGQLRPADFPPDWYAAREVIQKEKGNGKILFLPWHQYMEFGFAGKTIGNPAENFFGERIIQGDNMETSTAFTQSDRPESKIIEKHVYASERSAEEFCADLKGIQISQVILAKEDDWQDYAWIPKVNCLEKMSESENLMIFRLR